MSDLEDEAKRQGDLLREEGDFDGAIAAYTEAIRLNPTYAEAYWGRAYVYEVTGEFDLAIADYTESIRINPRHAEVYSERGYAYHKKGEFNLAIADYNKAIRLNPKHATTYYNRGLTYGKTGDHNQAIADFTEVIRLNPEDAEAYYSRGCVYAETGNYDSGISDFTAAIRINPYRAVFYRGRAPAYARKGEFDKAIADYTEAILLEPRSARAFEGRSWCYKQKGDNDKADADFAQAKRLECMAKSDRPVGRQATNKSRRLLAIIWASPYTLLGLFLGGIGLCTGGRVRIRDGVVEFYDGSVKWLLQRFPFVGGATACTLGHTVFGQSEAALDISHDHEMVHVRQFERWGPLMGPAYLGCSVVLWLMGRRPYRDNPFEREAYEHDGSEAGRF